MTDMFLLNVLQQQFY